MRLLLDGMHSPAAARALRDGGHDVVAMGERGDLRGAPDEEVLRVAAAEERAVVTENVGDVLPLVQAWAAAGREHHGVVLTNPRRFPRALSTYPGDLISALGAFLDAPPVTGASWTWWL